MSSDKYIAQVYIPGCLHKKMPPNGTCIALSPDHSATTSDMPMGDKSAQHRLLASLSTETSDILNELQRLEGEIETIYSEILKELEDSITAERDALGGFFNLAEDTFSELAIVMSKYELLLGKMNGFASFANKVSLIRKKVSLLKIAATSPHYRQT